MDCGSTILIFLAFIQATCSQTVTLTGPSAIERGIDTVYVCTGGPAPNTFIWEDLSEGGLNIFVNGNPSTTPLEYPKYVNFVVSETEVTSTMTISNTQIEDEGQYRCTEGTERADSAELTVEVKGTWSMLVESTIESNIDMYEATCEALDGRPEITITWMLDDGPSPCGEPVPMNPTAEPGLFSKTSVCTFQATSENYGQTLKCDIAGHQLQDLNGEVPFSLDIHSEPSAGILMVRFQSPDTSLIVSCVIDVANQPKPSTRNYYIFSNDSLIHQSSTEDNDVDVLESEFDLYTEFTCVAGNYLGNVTSNATRYDPTSTTTFTPTTTAETITPEGNAPTTPGLPTTQPSMTPKKNETRTPTDDGPNVAAIAGGVAGGIVGIGVIVAVIFIGKKKGWFESSGTPASSNKPSGRAVGSSNGSEKDVESPLNGVKDVTAEEKTRPEAAPRGHGSIQHTNDNPNQDMYAMVDKKKPAGGGGGGDVPDRGSGPGQNDPAAMLYADLDLSHKAGHTDKHVPKNENDVVVYSSILV